MGNVQGSAPEGSDDFLVFVDELPSLRIEDASNEVLTEAQNYYGQRSFGIMGAFEGSGSSGYRFSASPADN
ncbi:hypothetical protein QM797_16495 [Rhodococcus sp. IEGM 1381]|uniref:hypothetical protein n=1 Tax=Rhodococcus sp. IEGM 1381 TaxID=3047085 RepID=UPI0024B657F1|nr:hypothetical protein [Rhodococcus sp. IEGM 1381]MDI9896326.1 hypothetical protein [Rhodococcus sp. IEGM 1381]